MELEKKGEEIIPSAKRLINSLRSLGYEFPTAVAELVDNSIEAEATEINIRIEFYGVNSWVLVTDNGRGMTETQLKEAMRFGSDREYNEKSLGKFGLGLKTASFSQCKKWTVATRSNPQESEVIAYQWDLEHVNRTDRWEIIPVSSSELELPVMEFLNEHTGTAVLWKQLGNILDYKNPEGDHARNKMASMCRELEDHLAMVYHRFLYGETSGNQIRIILNGNEIRPWDPFSRHERATKEIEAIRIPLEHEGIHGEIVIEPYILPPKVSYSTLQEHTRAGGPRKWNQQQGFYIYRNDRMIQSGGWCRIRTYDEHTKLARFALNFSSKLDSAFKIDVSKMYVQLPPQIRKEIDEKTQPLVIRARDIYDQAEKPGRIETHPPPVPVDVPANLHQGTPAGKGKYTQIRPVSPPIDDVPRTGSERADITSRDVIPHQHNPPTRNVFGNNKLWTLDEVFLEIKKIARPDELVILKNLFDRIRDQIKDN
ncbi:hypothetical protein ASZ90_014594 [hydrocarbon metagenome]|uniref:ATP-binding protein n=1 Tax=hydrocarbon metagenome TaxID=938273 RepID=A0A0W8F4D8_9ZZZZ